MFVLQSIIFYFFLFDLIFFDKILLTFSPFSLQWIFWVGPFAGAALAAFYHQFVLRAGAVKALGSFRSQSHV